MEMIENERTIPLQVDTKCSKCNQGFWRDTASCLTTVCVDGEAHIWKSRTFDLEAKITALERALVEAREAIRAGLNYFSDTDCVELKKPTEGCETCKTISRFRDALAKINAVPEDGK